MRKICELWSKVWKRLWLHKSSGKIAKERLQILLVTDRVGCNPYTTEAIKKDLIRVLSKYIDVDKEKCSVEICHDSIPYLLANIPIKEVKI
ncbi:MAG: cell division topological specificity factor MinE [Eubacterium sp.]|nr:cell division topological specificity factor MinE [Eubacterium sp.]